MINLPTLEELPPPDDCWQASTPDNMSTQWCCEELIYTHASGAEISIFHVVPVGDTRLHLLAGTCWCEPTPDQDGDYLWTHHSADQRELFEAGARKPS